MKKTKVIIPALGILLLSTAASVTGTVAWFSMNADVKAQGMQVKALAEQGIVISNAANGTYSYAASSTKDGTTAELLPASTADLETWWHAKSNNPASATGIADSFDDISSNLDDYVVTHDFYIRSSAAEALSVTSLNVKDVLLTGTPAQDLSKALRVGVSFAGSTLTPAIIYAPVTGFTASYTVHNETAATAPVAGSVLAADNTIKTIPASTANGLHATVFIWFEGEDASCISNNIKATLEQLSVVVDFSYTA